MTQDGQLAALGDLRADIGTPFTFTRTLAAGGQLTLAVTGDLVQAGTLQGHGVTVTSTGTLTQQGASWRAAATARCRRRLSARRKAAVSRGAGR
nr:hypothetical protein [Dickeya dadantii]